MQKNRLKIWLVLINLVLFGLNFTPAMAQVLEIEVLGGGYRLKGPDVIGFSSLSASFAPQESIRDIRDLDPQNEETSSSAEAKDYLYIGDLNGGNAFNVGVDATDLEDSTTHETIPSTYFQIRNKNGTGADIVANNAAQPSLEGVSLNADTNDFASLDYQRILFSGEGRQPGAWRIFPVFKIKIPASKNPGTYTSTLTFTII
jgi:hypothetical protein